MATRPSPSDAHSLVRAALWVYVVDAAVFGVLTLLAPAFVVETLAGAEGFDYVWVRWAGGLLIALAFGAWQAVSGKAPVRFPLTVFGLAAVFAGLGFTLGWVRGEYDGAAWFLWLVLLATFGVGVLLLAARLRAE